MKRINTFRI